MKAALTGLLTRLRHAAVDGAVSESVFLEQAGALGLGDVERERLREELAGLGLPVLGAVVHADGDGPNAEKVARIREENVSSPVFPSGDVVRALLSRYADPKGYVTPRALDGVARLAGLGARDAAALRAGARVRGEAVATAEAAVTSAETAVRLTDVEEHEPEGVSEYEPYPWPETTTGGGIGDLTAAVAAALTVLENDRFRRRPEMRLLSAEAEVGLAVLVRGGPDRMAEEPDDDTLSGLPPDDLRIRARDCLVLHNQRLVHKMVPRYLDQGLDYDDLFQHGALGLMRAARKFDPAKGFKFSTYATWWVRQSISRGIADEGAVIRIPVHMHEQVRKVALAERTLAIQGRPAGVADVAVYCDMTMQKVEEARKLSRRTDSLDRVIGDGVTLGDFIGWTNPLPPVEKGVLDAMLLGQVMSVVDTLSEREAHILVRRLGLDGDEPSTLDELGKQIGRTRERVRQIESKAKTKVRYRLVEAGLTAAYRYDGGLEKESGRAGEPAGRQRAGSGAGVGAGARKESSGVKRVPDTLPNTAPKQAPLEVMAQSVEAGETLDGESLREQTAAKPGDHTAPGEALTDSATDTPSEALTALTVEPEEPADRRSEERSDDPPPVTERGLGPVVNAQDAESSIGLVPKPRTEPVLESAQERSRSAQAVTEASGPSVPEPVVPEPTQYTADWQKALRMPTGFGGGVAWLAEYALLAVGHAQLIVLLGPSSADAVARAVRDRGVLDRPVTTALEVLRRVFDAVKEAGLRPEDFFERPAEALVGMTPRAYLAAKPLVLSESRLALRDSLREFVAEVPLRAGQGAAPADSSPGSFVAGPHSEPGPGPEDSAQVRVAGVPDEGIAASPDGRRADVYSPSPKSPDEDRPGVARGDGPLEVGRNQVDTEANTVPGSERPQDDLAGPQAPPLRAGNPSADHGSADAPTAQEQPVSLLKAGRRSASAGTPEEMPRAGTANRGIGWGEAEPDAERRLTDVRRAYEAELTRERDEARRHLAEERQAADARRIAAPADTEQQLDALEETLLRRADRALLRKEQHLRAQAEERIARLKDGHREAQQTLVERAEHAELRERAARTALAAAGERGARAEQRANDAEQLARTAEQCANDAEQRASTAEERAAVLHLRANEAQRRAEETGQRLRRYREEGEARIAGLEQRLRQAEALLAERDGTLRAAQQQASAQVVAAEQRAAARIAQSEHDAWARITELQQQLAAEREPAADRSTLRDRWRRS
ncbi:sigma-70 family RNA polymerase sigma factor [Streptomyces sp. NBC_01728]|uniref:sigma-70 family RNA polymerase sigma factor n=1 Tax=unclassified Streptomyces TaxID=2593676 RepID=UPI002259A19F|nr:MULTISPECIES: sigma-70 family RNA polymerase sigma factor [unclassified Streptomyces]MCX4452206.1 sigma-70 family RNA polymerase sigma factor [Streptomyces sp. NBC_01719]MCX4491566.1 sigma-70 family RNA polymerase sigma factor [Streptomyces sp. NBC_01728]